MRPDKSERSTFHLPKKLVIIGGGIAGCMSALKAAAKGCNFDVILFEKGPDLLLGSSDATPGRVGQGFHYSDMETATQLLDISLEFVRDVKPPLVGENENDDHHLKHGLYYVLGNASEKVKKDVVRTCRGVRQKYTDYCNNAEEEDVVFGDPDDDFLKYLKSSNQYENQVDPKLVSKAYKTKEQLLDWPKFRQRIIDDIKANPKIQVYLNAHVTRPEFTEDGQYRIYYSQNGVAQEPVVTPYCINCTWFRSEILDTALGFKVAERANRIKVAAIIEAPQCADFNSQFGMPGDAGFMISNRGPDFIATYAQVTNVLAPNDPALTALQLPETWVKILDHEEDTLDALDDKVITTLMPDIFKNEKTKDLPLELQKYLIKTPRENWNIKELLLLYYGHRILNGLVHYIPKLKDPRTKVTGLKWGVVKVRGKNVDICDPKSDVHKRNFSGVSEHASLGWFTVESMKLICGHRDALKVVKFLNEHLLRDDGLTDRFLNDNSHLNEEEKQKKLSNIRGYFRRHYWEIFENTRSPSPRSKHKNSGSDQESSSSNPNSPKLASIEQIESPKKQPPGSKQKSSESPISNSLPREGDFEKRVGRKSEKADSEDETISNVRPRKALSEPCLFENQPTRISIYRNLSEGKKGSNSQSSFFRHASAGSPAGNFQDSLEADNLAERRPSGLEAGLFGAGEQKNLQKDPMNTYTPAVSPQ